MRAVTIHDDHTLTVEDHPDPTPGAGECLVRVRAAGLNGADIHQRAGNYPAPPGAPQDIPGLELAGEVIECGPGATRFKPGDRVMAIVAGGGQAELAVVHERMLMPVPDNLDWPQAGGTARGVHDRPRRAVHPGRTARRRAAARPRRRGRRRHRRRSSSVAPPAPASPRRSATQTCATRSPSSAPR